ncbi:HD-GYP domain-containing protein [Candidatus Latescibacterota bacterium]
MQQAQPQQYFPVYLKTIQPDTMQSFSIYIKVKGNMVLYHAGGEMLTREVIETLIESKVGVVYVSMKEKESYNKYLVDSMKFLINDKRIPLDERTKIAHLSVKSISQQFFLKPTMQSLPFYRTAISNISDFMLADDDALFNLVRLSSGNFENYIHSVNVGVFGTGLSKLMLGHDSRHNLKKISAGMFMHDIGKCMIPQAILTKPNPLNHNEWNIVKQHPVEGYKILSNMSMINDEIKVILTQHHERTSGRGYPRGLKGEQIHLYAKICSIADSFEALTSNRPYRKTVESSFNALLILKNEMAQDIDPQAFQYFVKLFSDSMKQ